MFRISTLHFKFNKFSKYFRNTTYHARYLSRNQLKPPTFLQTFQYIPTGTKNLFQNIKTYYQINKLLINELKYNESNEKSSVHIINSPRNSLCSSILLRSQQEHQRHFQRSIPQIIIPLLGALTPILGNFIFITLLMFPSLLSHHFLTSDGILYYKNESYKKRKKYIENVNKDNISYIYQATIYHSSVIEILPTFYIENKIHSLLKDIHNDNKQLLQEHYHRNCCNNMTWNQVLEACDIRGLYRNQCESELKRVLTDYLKCVESCYDSKKVEEEDYRVLLGGYIDNKYDSQRK